MINLRFSRLPKHRKFNYVPAFYDEAKEELHTRVADIKREMGEETDIPNNVKENIRRAYKAKQTSNRYGTAPGNKLYTVRIASIASILTVIVSYLWNSNLLKIIFESFTK